MSELREVNACQMSGGMVTVRLSDGSTCERAMTATEQAVRETIDELVSADLHEVWHRFKSEVLDEGEDNAERAGLAERFMEANPGWVTMAACDDDRFMSSDLCLVRHGTGHNHMGTTLVYLGQCEPGYTTLFLYPGHADSLLRALREIEPSLQALTPRGADLKQRAEEFMTRSQLKPTGFDFHLHRWREKPWYAEMGHLERLEELVTRCEP